MIQLVLKRVASGVVVLFVVSTLTFLILDFSSGNIARNILGDSASSAQVAAKEAALGLNRPLILRYFDWVGSAVRGDFGASWFTSQPVTTSIIARLPATHSVVFVTLLVVAIIATLLGVLAAVRRGWIDRFVQVLSIGGAAIPQFVAAVLIVTVFAVDLHWLPATGYVDSSAGSWVASIVLPVAALALGAIASTSQQVRSATIGVLGKDYVRTLRSRGLGNTEVVFRHVLRGAAPAALTVLSLQFIGMLGGVVIIEQIFALPGLGSLALQSSTQSDMPILMGVVVYFVVIVLVVNLLVDLAVGWLNPKARTS